MANVMRRSSFWLNVRLLVPWVRSVRTTIHYVDNTLSKISAISSLEDRSPCGPLGRSERTINWSYWWQYLMTYRMLHRGLLYLSRFIWSIKMWGLCTAPLCCKTLMFYVLLFVWLHNFCSGCHEYDIWSQYPCPYTKLLSYLSLLSK